MKPNEILEKAHDMLSKPGKWVNRSGDCFRSFCIVQATYQVCGEDSDESEAADEYVRMAVGCDYVSR